MRLFSRRKPAPPPPRPGRIFDTPIAPEAPFWAIGDVHGCAGLLDRLFDLMFAQGRPASMLVMLGDYVDRGDDSLQVLRRLHGIHAELGPEALVCLRGNHEQMFIDFLARPESAGPRWVRHGGLQTLASFGVPAPRSSAEPAQWIEARDRVREAMGAPMERWLSALPHSWMSGNVFACHAGADPARSVAHQDESVLTWGHADFEKEVRDDGIWVLHGHTIVTAANATSGRIALDTGAYATGKLSAALIEPGKLTFVST